MNSRKNYIVNGPVNAPSEEIGNLIYDAVNWFLAKYNMQDVGNRFGGRHHTETVRITVNASTMKDLDCYGQCYEWDGDITKCNYVIDVACDQGLRDLLATVFHECVHLWQWERNHWKGYGEREANELEYQLADEYWRSGNV
jgi:hypothetical protein